MTRKRRRKLLRLLTTGVGTFLLVASLCGGVVLTTTFSVPFWVSSVLFVTAIYGAGIIIFGFYAFRSN
ncbi:MAG TPA: hypothetical protein VNH44_09525 [Micropepsaceae bacterium]|nr:hypothetical protein [Micropepsaceae bacterium]